MSPHLEHVVLRLLSGTVSPRQCSELTLTLPFLEKASTRVISDQFIAISVVDAFSDPFYKAAAMDVLALLPRLCPPWVSVTPAFCLLLLVLLVSYLRNHS